MSILGRQISPRIIAILVLLMIVGAFLPALSHTPSREITLVVKGMAFYVEGNPEPNPTIEVEAGETIRMVVRNQDRGITHDFALPTLSVGIDPIDWNENESFTFTAPDAPGTHEYMCRPHRLMMRGALRVVERPLRD